MSATTYNVREDDTYIDYEIETSFSKGSYTGRYDLKVEGAYVGWVIKDDNTYKGEGISWSAYATREALNRAYDSRGNYEGVYGYTMAEEMDTRTDAVEFMLTRLHDGGHITGTRIGEPAWAARLRAMNS